MTDSDPANPKILTLKVLKQNLPCVMMGVFHQKFPTTRAVCNCIKFLKLLWWLHNWLLVFLGEYLMKIEKLNWVRLEHTQSKYYMPLTEYVWEFQRWYIVTQLFSTQSELWQLLGCTVILQMILWSSAAIFV